MGRASRTSKRNSQKILTPSRISFLKNKKPQIINIDCGGIVNPEIICLDGNNCHRNPQLIDLEDDDVTVLTTHTASIRKKKRLKNKCKNDDLIFSDDIFIDALSNSTRQCAHAANSRKLESKFTSTKENSISECPESGSPAKNNPVASPGAINVEQLSNLKQQPPSQLSVSNFSLDTGFKKSSRNCLNSPSPPKTDQHFPSLASDQPLSNFTPYKRSYNLPELSEIPFLKQERNAPNLLSENSPCDHPIESANNCSAGPNKFKEKAYTRNERKSIKQTAAQQISNNTENHRYPLRSRGQPVPALYKSLPKQSNGNKKSRARKKKGNNQKLSISTPGHNNNSLGSTKKLNDTLQNHFYNIQCQKQENLLRENAARISPSINDVTVIGTKSAELSGKKIETKIYGSLNRESEDEMIRTKESSSPALNFIPISSASKEIENELVQIYKTNKNRKSMKTDLSRANINLEGSTHKFVALINTKNKEKSLKRKKQKSKKKKLKSLKKQEKKNKKELRRVEAKKKLKEFSGLKTFKKGENNFKQKLNRSRNFRPSVKPKNPGHSTPFKECFKDWESEGSMMNFNDRSICDFNWITLDACYNNSEDEAHTSASSASCNLPVIAAVSPTNYRRSRSKNPSHGSSFDAKNESAASSCVEISVDKGVMNSEKEVVVIDDSDKAIDVDDSLSLSSEESFSVDVGTNVFVPDGVSFKGQRPIIIDGSNVAFGHGISTRGLRVFSSRGIEICAKYFTKRGHKVIVFVPLFRRWSSHTLNPEILQKMSDRGLVTYTPSRKIDSKLSVPYDDRYIVQCAVALGGVIVSTDNYRDLLRENPTWKSTIEKRLLMFTFVGDMLMFPQDPLGRHGPKLDEFLMFPR